jgi:hypothetical protein
MCEATMNQSAVLFRGGARPGFSNLIIQVDDLTTFLQFEKKGLKGIFAVSDSSA